MAQLAATGISVRPMVVMTVPVTTGGKNRMILENSGVMSRPISDAAITEPKTAWIPPPPWTIATMVETPAKETPWTRGSWDPKNGMPTVWRIVARPPTKRQAAISRPMSCDDMPGGCADDQRRGDDAAVHGEDVLEAVGERASQGKSLVFGPVGLFAAGAGHCSGRFLLDVHGRLSGVHGRRLCLANGVWLTNLGSLGGFAYGLNQRMPGGWACTQIPTMDFDRPQRISGGLAEAGDAGPGDVRRSGVFALDRGLDQAVRAVGGEEDLVGVVEAERARGPPGSGACWAWRT